MTDGTPDVGTDVVVAPRAIDPVTGEVVDVIASTPTDRLADVRDLLVAHKSEVDAACRTIDAEIVRRLDHDGRRSGEVKGEFGVFKVTAAAPVKIEWDGRGAYLALRRLVREGILSLDRANECVTRTTTYSHAHGALSHLLKHADPRVRDAIAACRSEKRVEGRRVSVTRQQPRR